MNTTKLKDLFEKSSDKYADAKAIGTTYQSMYNIIYKGDLIERIAKFYGVPVGYFFDEEKEESKTTTCPYCGHSLKINIE